MNVIFGSAPPEVLEKYIMLELDTIKVQDMPVTAYCLVDNLPLAEYPKLETNKQTHANLMEEYKKQNWEYCERAIDILTGAWNKEVDSFYMILRARIAEFKRNPPPADWAGVIEKEQSY